MEARNDTIVTLVVAAAAIAVAAASLHREFGPSKVPAALAATSPEPYVKSWREMLPSGIVVGDTNAAVKVVEFADFECPFCRRFHTAYERVQKQYGSKIALVFVHYPLPNHRFARPAARAAECAAKQGRFDGFQRVAFEKQDSLGLKSWSSYAAEAGVTDSARFSQCAADTARVGRIEAGLLLGAKIRVQGTPTIIINGWRLTGLYSDSLSEVIDRISTGHSPDGSIARRTSQQ